MINNKIQNRRHVCYMCHKPISETENKWFCPECKKINENKRVSKADLNGRIALVTGGRIKIGFETCLNLLRNGAFVILTTRFPIDAAYRYAKERDFEKWRSRLKIYKLDFRNIIQVEEFSSFLNSNISHLDILINNAAQTVRKPRNYYEHLRKLEIRELKELPKHIKDLIYDKNIALDFFQYQSDVDMLHISKMTEMKMLLGGSVDFENNNFPIGEIDTNGEPLDLRSKNSWVSKAEDITTIELLEVQLVNVTSPFILCTRLKELMKKSPNKYRFIINVSAMEGKFSKKNKNCFHPHTNMAKAALNMLTRTVAQEYALDGIYMNSVDTGWITDENPYNIQINNRSKGIIPPLDCRDGAARICDPIIEGINNSVFSYGLFYKNYKKTNW